MGKLYKEPGFWLIAIPVLAFWCYSAECFGMIGRIVTAFIGGVWTLLAGGIWFYLARRRSDGPSPMVRVGVFVALLLQYPFLVWCPLPLYGRIALSLPELRQLAANAPTWDKAGPRYGKAVLHRAGSIRYWIVFKDPDRNAVVFWPVDPRDPRMGDYDVALVYGEPRIITHSEGPPDWYHRLFGNWYEGEDLFWW